MPNRAQRRLEKKKVKAIARYLTPLNKTEEKEYWYREGFNAAVKACYAAFAISIENRLAQDDEDTLLTLQDADNRLAFFIGEDELIEEAFEKTGLALDFSGTFTEDRIQRRKVDADKIGNNGVADS